MIEAKFFLHLLVHLLAHPARFDQGCQSLQRRVGRVVGEVVLPLTRGAVLAHQPDLVAREMLALAHGQPVGDPHAGRRERRLERAFGADPPGEGAEWRAAIRLGLARQSGWDTVSAVTQGGRSPTGVTALTVTVRP